MTYCDFCEEPTDSVHVENCGTPAELLLCGDCHEWREQHCHGCETEIEPGAPKDEGGRWCQRCTPDLYEEALSNTGT